jgi:hypothetical protein
MIAIMEDTSADPQRRDAMAVAAATYCHPRLSSITTSNTNVNFEGGGDISLQILAVPRGALIDKSGKVVLDGEGAELTPIEPYAGTPGIDAMPQLPPPVESAPAESSPVEPESDATNIMPLNAWRRRDDAGGQ